jgi:hypothetical protein
MVTCQLCQKKFKNKQGLSIHLARAHNVHGRRGRLSLKTIHQFFPLLKKRKWAKAERFLQQVEQKGSEDKWIRGYVQALEGMITTLKVDGSFPRPFIYELKSYSRRERLHEVEKEFTELSEKQLNTEYDRGYFRVWTDYTHFLYRMIEMTNADVHGESETKTTGITASER